MGNRIEFVDHPKAKYRWTAFVRFSSNCLETKGLDISKFIEKVTFQVHPTYPKPHIKEKT